MIMLDVSLPASQLFSIGPIPITDAMLGAVLTTLILVFVGVASARKFAIIPTRIQVLFEMGANYFLEQVEQAFGPKKARAFFPVFFTLMLFILVANESTMLPFIYEIVYNGADVFRQPTSDFSGPIAFSLTLVVVSHIMAFYISPITHLKNFFPIDAVFASRSVSDFFLACIGMMIGLLNIVGEFAKVISLAARLFGNVFAGNLMVAVIMGIAVWMQWIVPIPFLALGVFSGLIQAFVFSLLSIQFLAGTIEGATPQPKEETAQAMA